MKGIVFTEFIDLVESAWSPEIADRVIAESNSSTGGAYTAVGTYDHRELVRMVVALGTTTGVPVPELLRRFGHHLAGRFAERFPRFFESQPTLFDFLASIDSVIHVEVRKLYPDAELPSFEVARRDDRHMTLVYRSTRHMAPLAQGLIEASARHYRTPIELGFDTRDDGRVVFEVKQHCHVGVD